MKESAVKVQGRAVFPQHQFARHIRHVPGGYELYRAEVRHSEVVLLLYVSGSGKTERATEVGGTREWDYWDDAEKELGLGEGALKTAFWGG